MHAVPKELRRSRSRSLHLLTLQGGFLAQTRANPLQIIGCYRLAIDEG
jgi:hypothetical protein